MNHSLHAESRTVPLWIWRLPHHGTPSAPSLASSSSPVSPDTCAHIRLYTTQEASRARKSAQLACGLRHRFITRCIYASTLPPTPPPSSPTYQLIMPSGMGFLLCKVLMRLRLLSRICGTRMNGAISPFTFIHPVTDLTLLPPQTLSHPIPLPS